MITPLHVLLISDGDTTPVIHALEPGGFRAEITKVRSLEDLDDALEDEDWDWDIVVVDPEILSITDVVHAVEMEQADLPIFALIRPGDEAACDSATERVTVADLSNLGIIVKRVLHSEQPDSLEAESPRQDLQATDALADMETIYRAISELATDYAFAIRRDRDGNDEVLWSDGGFERVMGSPIEAIYGLQGMLSMVRPDHHAEASAAFSTLSDDGASEIDLPIITKSGDEKWMRNRFMATQEADSECAIIYCCGEDFTAHKRAEEELVAAREQAEELVRLKGAFLANMSHEIRTPLTGILGFASLLAADAEGEAREFADYVEQSGQRLLDTLDSILDLSRIDGNRFEVELKPVDAVAEARRVLDLLEPRAKEKGIALVLSSPDEPVHAFVDAGCFSRVLTNMIGNGIKFTEEGQVEVALSAEGDSVRLEIRDTGIGIDPVLAERVFDEFRQGSVSSTGDRETSGLGLVISKRLVELMMGTIEVQSSGSGGTTFAILLQRAEVEESVGVEEFSIRIENEPWGEPTLLSKIDDLSGEDNDQSPQHADDSAASSFLDEFASGSPGEARFTFTDLVIPEQSAGTVTVETEAETEEANDYPVEDDFQPVGDEAEPPLFEFDAAAVYASQDEEEMDANGDFAPSEIPELSGGGLQPSPFEFEDAADEEAGMANGELDHEVPADIAEPLEPIVDDRASVLVVEDNPDTRRLVERILKRSYNVTSVGDARSALGLMAKRRFDGLVLDINLGGKETGVDILRISRTLPGYADVFAIALTAYALSGDRERFLEAGFSRYVSKPFTRSTLMAALADGLAVAA